MLSHPLLRFWSTAEVVTPGGFPGGRRLVRRRRFVMSPNHPSVRSLHPETPLVIDCDTCAVRSEAACGDCLMSFLVGHPGSTEATVIDLDEARALRRLSDGGLVPGIRHTVV